MTRNCNGVRISTYIIAVVLVVCVASPISTYFGLRDVLASSVFVVRGVNMSIDTLTPGAPYYQPNGWTRLRSLGVNVIRVSGGIWGDVVHFNMDKYPNEWAQNLDSFLSTANSYGMRVTFNELGNNHETLFNITAPHGTHPGTPIAKAKLMIGELAGNNSLHHNFITDPRIFAWSVANEPDVSYTLVSSWLVQVCDYIRSYGGKAYVSAPQWGPITITAWIAEDLDQITPLFAGHVNYFEVHGYDPTTAYNAQQAGSSVYTAVYNDFKNNLLTHFVNKRGSMPLSNMILGEFGIWLGCAPNFNGITQCFTAQSVTDYYNGVYDAVRDAGLINVFQFDMFAVQDRNGNLINHFSAVNTNGTAIVSKTNVIQSKYLGVSTTTSTTSTTVQTSTTSSITSHTSTTTLSSTTHTSTSTTPVTTTSTSSSITHTSTTSTMSSSTSHTSTMTYTSTITYTTTMKVTTTVANAGLWRSSQLSGIKSCPAAYIR